jgi:hypothetical protein
MEVTAAPRMTLHAGAVSAGGTGILLPGPRRAGKSVLTLALLQKGCEFLADDVAILDHGTLELLPHDEEIAVRADGPGLFPELARGWSRLRAADDAGHVALTTAARIGAVQARRCPVELIVFPSYDAGGPRAQVEPIAPGRAVLKVLERSIRLGGPLPAALDVITALVRNAQPFTLRFHDVRAACEQVIDLADTVSAKAPQLTHA